MSLLCFVYPNKLSVVWCCAFSFCRPWPCAESVQARVVQFFGKYFINAKEEAKKKNWKKTNFFLPFSLHTCLENNWSATTHRQINIFSCLQDMSVTFVRRCTYLLLDRNINFNSCSKIPTTIHLSHVVSQWTVTLVHRSCLYLWDK